jgi:hypothetical protein
VTLEAFGGSGHHLSQAGPSSAQLELAALRGANTYHAEHDHAAGVLEGVQYWLGRNADTLTATESTTGGEHGQDDTTRG